MARDRKKRKTINVHEIYEVQVTPRDEAHEIVFSTPAYVVRVHAHRWLLVQLARQLWDVHKFDVTGTEHFRKALRGE